MGQSWLREHKTLAGVLVLTVMMAVLVLQHRMPVDRAFVAFAICWALAMNSETIHDHQVQTIAEMRAVVPANAKADDEADS